MNQNELAPLTKKERGRLKKLRKRALEVKDGCETSGLSQLEDWLEWGRLQRKGDELQIGPSIRLRKNMDANVSSKLWHRAEGNDHCHILFNLLFPRNRGTTPTNSNNSPKKRPRSADLSVPIPSWATLHNPGSMDNVAILQIHIESGTTSWDDVLVQLPSVRSLFSQDNSQNGPKCDVSPLQTRWFQGPHPRSMSDALLYVPKVTIEKNTVKKKEKDNSSSASDVSSLLKDLILSSEQLSKEGYPILEPKTDQLASPEAEQCRKQTEGAILERATTEKLSASSFSQIESKDFVSKIMDVTNFDNVDDGGETDKQNDPYVSTFRQRTNNSNEIRLFAVDCEMVRTAAGLELARVTLLQLQDFSEMDGVSYNIVIDELVKPSRPILDYLTNYSGITARQLEKITMRREQIQIFLLAYLEKDDILIGHSLENDLRALKLVHNKVVDTSVLFAAKHGRKYSLKHLSATLLKKQIQNQDVDGHCSEEDALAALDLAVRRAWFGSSLRIYEKGDDRSHLLETYNDYQHRQRNKSSIGQMVCVGSTNWLQDHVISHRHSAHALTCEEVHDPNVKAIQSWMTSQTRRAKIVWADLCVSEKKDSMGKLNEILRNLLGQISPGTMLLLALQRGHHTAANLTKQRRACKNPKSTVGWSESQESEWKMAVENSRSGIVCWVGMQ